MPDDSNTPLYALPFEERTLVVRSVGGANVPVYDWGGDGPPLIICHATGLHAHVYAPLAAKLRDSFRCIGVDARGQGDASLPIDGDLSWRHITTDYVAAVDALGLAGNGDVYAVGHSQGGYAAISMTLRRPGTFAGVFGFEPVIFPLPPGVEPYKAFDNELAVVVRRRRAEFPSLRDAYDNFRAKPPFASADDDVVRAYVQWGFTVRDDGSVVLKCLPETEAELFANSPTDLLQHLGEVDCPVILGVAEHTAPNFLTSVPMQAERIPNSKLLHFPGRTHFLPLERVDEIADTIRTAFGR